MTPTTPRRSGRRSSLLASSLGLALAATGLAGTAAVAAGPDEVSSGGSDASRSSRTAGGDAVVALLTADPLSTSDAVSRGRSGEVRQAAPATRNAKARLARQRNDLRRWLRTNAPDVQVTGGFDFALNGVSLRLNGTDESLVARGPRVRAVVPQATYSPLVEAAPSTAPVSADPDLDLVDAPEGWTAVGATTDDSDPVTEWAGYGTRVAIVDSGIDTTHPCFDDTGYPRAQQLGERSYTNNKVVVAKVFNNKAANRGLDAEAVDSHGTHVAGTVACNLLTPAVAEGAEIPYDPSGVAPGARLGNYNVFPGAVSNARSEDILNALDAAAADGMDVVNMSLGGGYSGRQDLLTIASDNLDRAGIVVAVANGNDGPGYFTGGSPGSAERALTAGASGVGHLVGVPVHAGEGTDGPVVTTGAAGDFPVPSDAPFTGELVVQAGPEPTTGLDDACSAVSPAPAADAVALISRGACTFAQKLTTVQDAGYEAGIVVNNRPGDPIAMGGNGTATDPTIFAVMAPLSDLDALVAQDGEPVTIGNEPAYTRTPFDDVLADFSSWGPTRVDYRIKPDVTAPGANVLSSVPTSECVDDDSYDPSIGCWAFFSGTSMATPHLAGMAAVVRAADPGLAAYAVRSAIINTADVDGVTDVSGTPVTDVLKVGAGLAQLDEAVAATLALSRPSVSFGSVPSGAGKTLSTTLEVTNTSDATVATTPVVTGSDGFSVRGPAELDAGETGTFTVTFGAAKGATKGFRQAVVDFGDEAHAALFTALT